ncbi:MAG: mechanosensitive ion channel [Candidatus Latescibacteria bacterium]|nr:mechanosensitive ion channel [Candidatus Latescibacterota bacterium]
MEEIIFVISPFFRPLILLVLSILIGLILHYLLFKILDRIAQNTQTLFDDLLVKYCKKPSRWIILLIIVNFVLPLFILYSPILGFFEKAVSMLLILSVAWLLINLTTVFEELIFDQYKIDVEDNLRARKILTQIKFLKKVAIIIISIIAFSTILMTFDKVRQLGTSILASAGIIGIIVGFAAQRSIGTLLAGLQIAFTQPIRIDDVVIVENEWGKIEEITLTYVVVRIWDLRRLVLPITYFIEKPFQNWTRVSAELMGTVFIYSDYSIPIQAVREELARVLDSSEIWDRKVCVLQVTSSTEHTLELRALMSAQDASKLWTLRCEVREKLVEYIRENYPESLPKVRAELKSVSESDSLTT